MRGKFPTQHQNVHTPITASFSLRLPLTGTLFDVCPVDILYLALLYLARLCFDNSFTTVYAQNLL